MTEEKRKTNPILWFMFIIVIPTVFALMVTGAVVYFTGYGEKLKELGKNIPIVSSYIFVEDEEETVDVDQLTQTIEQQIKEIESLNKTIEKKEEEIKKVSDKIVEMEEQLEKEKNRTVEAVETITDIATTYELMAPDIAAGIISKLSNEEAQMVLNHMKHESRSKILEEMETEKAAVIMSLLIKREGSD